MSGGGDTPVSNTYVAIYDPGSLSVGQFYVGKIEDNTLKYYGSTANDEIIIVDSDGQKVSNAEFDQSLGNTLFQKVKEVYANIADDEIIDYSLTQGETIPDWSEYVQIGVTPVQSTKYAFAANTSQSGNDYIIGVVDETHYKVYCTPNGNEMAYLINESGKYVNTIDISAANIKSYIVSKLQTAGVQIEDIIIDNSVVYEILSTIPDWADYTKIVP